MTDPFLGEVQIFGFTFAPRGWAFANGAIKPIQQSTALYSLIGTTYGGNGTITFQLPNLANRVFCSQGTAPGLSQRAMGETFGEDSVALTAATMPAHIHTITAYTQRGTANKVGQPSTGFLLGTPSLSTAVVPNAPGPNVTLGAQTIGLAGGNQPHDNHQPFLAMNHSIALNGNFPSFN